MIDTNRFCRVQFNAFQLRCDVRVNDISIVTLPGAKNLSTVFNINEWVREGENTLSIDLSGDQPELTAAAVMRVVIGLSPEQTGTDLDTILTVEIDKEDVAAGIILRPFHLPALAFGTYDEHLLEPVRPDDRQLLATFRRTYEAYYHAVASRDMDAVLRYHEYRTAAYALRYYEPLAQRAAALRETFADSFANEFLLKRIPELEKPNLHMGGRLITMDYADDGLPLTTFTGRGAAYTRAYQVYWGLDQQGRFFIFR